MTESAEIIEATEPPIPEQEDHFRTDHLQANLMNRSLKGGVFTFGAQLIKLVLNFVSVMAMARLLAVEDFGLVAKVTPIAGFIGVFRDLGLSMATIQRDEINHDQVSSLFWINVYAAILLSLTVAAISPLVGLFFGDPRTMYVTLALAATFIFSGLSAQHSALLYRQMKFKTTAIIDVSAIGASVVAGIIAGLLHWGYWSLLAMQFVQAMGYTAGYWFGCSWRPGKLKRGSGIRSMLAFGGGVTANTIGHYIGDNSDRLMVGKMLGDYPSGLYSRALGLLITPVAQFSTPFLSVFTPALCRASNEPKRFEHIMSVATRMILMMATPMMSVILIAPEAVTLLVFGPRWKDVVPIFRPLAICLAAIPLHALYFYALRASGNTRALVFYGVSYAIIMPISVLIGMYVDGVIGVAYAYAISDIVLRLPLHAAATAWGARISLWAMIKPFGLFLVGCVFSFGGAFGAWWLVRNASLHIVQVAVTGIGGTVLFAAWLLISGQVKETIRLVKSVR